MVALTVVSRLAASQNSRKDFTLSIRVRSVGVE